MVALPSRFRTRTRAGERSGYPARVSTPENDTAPLERIELKLAFLERANTELSDVVYRQQQEIEALRAQLAALIARLQAAQAEETPYTLEQERPPHY